MKENKPKNLFRSKRQRDDAAKPREEREREREKELGNCSRN
jgi:hypothetical protein